MAKSVPHISEPTRGRPKTTGQGVGILVRGHEDFLQSLDKWIAKQKPRLSRPEAIRRLVELGLTLETKLSLSSEGQKLRAREMAGKAIDRMADATAHPDSQPKVSSAQGT